MGTFHDDKGELHGITVVVETDHGETWVGRCHEVTPAGVLLHDADVHRGGEGEPSKEAYLARAAQWGVWPRIPRTLVPGARVRSIRRLGSLPAAAPASGAG